GDWCAMGGLLSRFQRAKVVAHDIPQPQRDVVAFQRPVGRVAVIPKDLIVWHKRLSGWVLSKFTFLHRDIAGVRLQNNLRPAFTTDPLRRIYRRKLTFTRAIGVIVLRNLPAGRGRHVVVAGAALLVTSASANTGLLLFRLSLPLLVGSLLADLLAGLIASFSLLLPRLSALTRLAGLLSLLLSLRLPLLLRPLLLQRLHAGVRLA